MGSLDEEKSKHIAVVFLYSNNKDVAIAEMKVVHNWIGSSSLRLTNRRNSQSGLQTIGIGIGCDKISNY
jgi:hypothetical protein